MTLLKRVINKCYFLQGKNSYSDTLLKDPYKDLTEEFLHNILKNLVCKMCIEIFVKPCSSIEQFGKLIDDNYPVGCFNDCAHIFACVHKILTTFDSKTTKSRPHEDETKESASDREQRLHARSFGNHSKVLDIPGTLQMDLEQPGDCELQMSTFVEVDVELNALHHLMPTIENEPDWNVPRMDYEKGADLTEFLPPMDRSKIEPGRNVGQTRMMEYEKGQFDGRKVRQTKMMEYEKGRSDGRKIPQTKEMEYEKGRFDWRKVPQTREKEYVDKESDFNKIPHLHHSSTSDSEEGETQQRLREEPLRSATDCKKSDLRIERIRGMVRQVFFKNGCLYLPSVQLHDRTESYFRNLAMYEVFDHYDEKRHHAFTDYLHLMSDLIKTPEDIAYLIDDCKVIKNLLGTHHNAFEMWERLQRGLLHPEYSKKYRMEIVDPVNLQCDNPTPITALKNTEFYDRFCSKPWLAISVITAAVLLLATLIQTYVSVIGSDKMHLIFLGVVKTGVRNLGICILFMDRYIAWYK
jgi:hypothetical protein